FARWQREWLSGQELEGQLAYWKESLRGAAPVLELPADHPRPARQSHRGARRTFSWPISLLEDLRSLSRRQDSTLFMTLVAGFMALLSRYSGQADVSLGTPIAGRGQSETEGLIGFFVNTLVMRADLSGEPDFTAFLKQVRDTALGAFAHQDVPFEQVVEALAPQRTLSHSPLFQVIFAFQNVPPARLQMAGLELTPLAVRSSTSRFDISLSISEDSDGLHGMADYCLDLFEAQTVDRLLAHYRNLLQEITAHPKRSLFSLPLLEESERAQMLAEWNATQRDYPRDSTLAQLFRLQADQMADAVALATAWGGDQVSYAQLDRWSDRLASRLRKEATGSEALAAIFAERSAAMVAGLLGILKASAAYLPLDPAYPPERLSLMLSDAHAAAVLVQPQLLERLPQTDAANVCLDECSQDGESPLPIALGQDPQKLAYVMYTSGSTGTPKGVSVPQRAVVRLVRGTEYARLGRNQVFLQMATLSFDASTFQIWGCLLNGGRLVLFPPQKPTLDQICTVVARHGITMLGLPAALFRLLADHHLEVLAGLQQVLSGGDVLSPSHSRRALDAGLGRLINAYGPTENTTYTCCHVMTGPGEWATVPIGRPIANTQVFVLDRHWNPVPQGVAGELFIAGDGLARGYWQRPSWTAERFLPHPFEDGQRLYRTGDRVRQRQGGLVEFLGRLDHQAKIRGFRVEPAEVEALLLKHPAVRQAAVVAWPDPSGGKRLVAYVAGKESGVRSQESGRAESGIRNLEPEASPPQPPAPSLQSDSLRLFLSQHLPDYMIPSLFISLDQLPLTPTGKIDRRALPEEGESQPRQELVEPSTPAEEVLAAIWCDVLGVERAGRNDHFFELGGHSLLATQAASQIRRAFQVELPLRTLFEFPQLSSLARQIEEARFKGERPSAPPLRPVGRRRRLPLSFAQRRLWFLDQLEPGSAIYNIPMPARLEGQLDVAALQAALSEIQRRHEGLRTVFPVVSGEPLQKILPPSPFPLPLVDLTSVPQGPRGRELNRLVSEEAQRPFDLAQGPLMRAALVIEKESGVRNQEAGRAESGGRGSGFRVPGSGPQTPESEKPGARSPQPETSPLRPYSLTSSQPSSPASCLLLATMHHIVSDAWSSGVLLRELSTFYSAFSSSEPGALNLEPGTLPSLPIQYADFAVWQREWLRGAELGRQLVYWKRRLEGLAPLELPTDRPYASRSSMRGGLAEFSWPSRLTEPLRGLSRSHQSTLFMTVLALFQALLSRYSGQDDVSVGTPLANRNRAETEGLIGFFVNTLVLRTRLGGNPSFEELL
ncbi:MAG: amino acid adenylation domain-containing protein, partial [Acidobacteriota bacterium]